MEPKRTTEAGVWVICRACGEKHQLKRGISAPIYWCGNNLHRLVVGDEVEYSSEDTT